MVIGGHNAQRGIKRGDVLISKPWKTKYPLAVKKIEAYATAFLGNLRLEDAVPHCEIQSCEARASRDLMDLRGRVNTCT
jgi:hypothetical protein